MSPSARRAPAHRALLAGVLLCCCAGLGEASGDGQRSEPRRYARKEEAHGRRDRHDRHHHYPGGLLESGLPGLELRGAITDPSGPLCANLSLPVRAALRLVPAPSADKLCPNLLTGPLHPCTLGALIEHFLQRTAGAARCNKAGQVAPPGAPDRLPDRRPLPPGAFADPGAVFSAEGATHHWLYRVILNLEAYLGCFLVEGSAWTPPAGWDLVAMATVQDASLGQLPFAAILHNPLRRQLVVAIRGTMTANEWLVDFTYNQTQVPDFGAPVHYGFLGMFRQIWPTVQAALDTLVLDANTDVFVAGHSLGGGVGTLVALAAQQHLDARLGAGPVVSAVVYGAPTVGGPAFVNLFNARVNARRVAFQYDIVPQAFCADMPACRPGRQPGLVGAILWANGISIVPTDQPGGVASWPFTPIGGTLPILAGGMPQDAATWRALSRTQLCWALQFLWASHVCVYNCFTSQFAPGATSNQCWLSAKPGGAPGTQCPSWPSDYPPATP